MSLNKRAVESSASNPVQNTEMRLFTLALCDVELLWQQTLLNSPQNSCKILKEPTNC
jgi:hypothetical protein